jgi:hypothetical protein
MSLSTALFILTRRDTELNTVKLFNISSVDIIPVQTDKFILFSTLQSASAVYGHHQVNNFTFTLYFSRYYSLTLAKVYNLGGRS